MTSTQGKIWDHAKYQGSDLIRRRIKLLLLVRLSDCRMAADHKVARWEHLTPRVTGGVE